MDIKQVPMVKFDNFKNKVEKATKIMKFQYNPKIFYDLEKESCGKMLLMTRRELILHFMRVLARENNAADLFYSMHYALCLLDQIKGEESKVIFYFD